MSPAPEPPFEPWPALRTLPAGDVLVFAPDPAGWLGPMLRRLGSRAVVWAPWARARPARLPLPGALARALTRRTLPDQPRLRRLPGFDVADVALARLAADRPRRQYPLAHHRRIALGHAAARWLPRARPAAVVAPCFAATPLFAAARDLGAKTVLLHDWPDLAALHADLDAAAAHHPADPWLGRFRPPARWIAEQRSERHLADHILVRGRFVADRVVADGITSARIIQPSVIPSNPVADRAADAPVLLIGRGSARSGGHEAVALLEAMPKLRLIGPLGSAALPELRSHPRYAISDEQPWSMVRAVLAPAWAEAYPRTVSGAAARGLPVIATDRAAGALASDDYRRVERGDVDGMRAALQRL